MHVCNLYLLKYNILNWIRPMHTKITAELFSESCFCRHMNVDVFFSWPAALPPLVSRTARIWYAENLNCVWSASGDTRYHCVRHSALCWRTCVLLYQFPCLMHVPINANVSVCLCGRAHPAVHTLHRAHTQAQAHRSRMVGIRNSLCECLKSKQQ